MFTVDLNGEIEHKEYFLILWEAKAAARRGRKADGINRKVLTWPEPRMVYDTASEPPAPEFDAMSYVADVFGTPNTEGASGESSGSQQTKPEQQPQVDELSWQYTLNRESASGGTEPY